LGCAFVETFAESVFLAIGFFAVDLRGADFTDFLSVTGAVLSAAAGALESCFAASCLAFFLHRLNEHY